MAELTPTNQDYVKVIWGSGEWTDAPVTTTGLAEHLSLSPSTVSEAVRRLAEQGLVEHRPYGSIELTDVGIEEAVKMVRRHRLLETFLFRQLGYEWHEVHDEAEKLEHAVSDKMIQRIDDLLGSPTRDPHGDPIPFPDGSLPDLEAVRLSEIDPGGAWTVARVSDREPQILRYLARIGIGLDTELEVLEKKGFAGTVTVKVEGRELELGIPAADAIWVSGEFG